MARSRAPSPYQLARLRARALAGQLSAASAGRIASDLAAMALRLEQQLAQLPHGTPAATRAALEASRRITRQAMEELHVSLQAAVAENRSLAFGEVHAVWAAASRSAGLAVGVPDALFGAVQSPRLLTAGAFEALGGASHTWKTSLTLYAKAGHADIDTIVRQVLTDGVHPAELARRLRPYVTGAEPFEKAFPRADERWQALHNHRGLKGELRNAAYRMRANSLRIAYTEPHNARAEAELQAFALDPVIGAVQWELSPYRGTQDGPDICDVYATNDFYGLGRGIYPLDAVPLPPHPRDRCERVPVERDPADWGKPKPLGLKRILDPGQIKVQGTRSRPLTAAQLARIRDQVSTAFRLQERHASTKAFRQLVHHAEKETAGLVQAVAERRQLLGTPLQPATLPVPPPAPPPVPTGPELRQQLDEVGAKRDRVLGGLRTQLHEVTVHESTLRREARAWAASQGAGVSVADAPTWAAAERAARRYDQLRRRAVAAEAGSRKRIERTLTAPGEATTATLEMRGRVPAWKAKAEEGVRAFRRLVPAGHIDGETFSLRRKATRAYFSFKERTAYLSDSNSVAVFVHELGHGLEKFSRQDILARAVAFRDRRTAGESAVRLADLFPGAGYRLNEVTKKDRFRHPYAGKLYRSGGADTATEIISMGLEWLVGDPVGFAREDPEYFDFMIDILWRTNP